jgi:hypothetical protein
MPMVCVQPLLALLVPAVLLLLLSLLQLTSMAVLSAPQAFGLGHLWQHR